jgi:E3 ubiquitin-protein ligase ATL6/9/15/31/42/55
MEQNFFDYAPNPAQSFPPQPPPTALVLFAVLLFFVFGNFSILFSFYNCYCRSRVDDLAEQVNEEALMPATQFRLISNCQGTDPIIIQALPIYPYDAVDDKYLQNECTVCLCDFHHNEPVKLIPFCKHVFHPDCLDKWLSSHMTCPVCRSTSFFESDERLEVIIDDGGFKGVTRRQEPTLLLPTDPEP